jgi:hypothetical protein
VFHQENGNQSNIAQIEVKQKRRKKTRKEAEMLFFRTECRFVQLFQPVEAAHHKRSCGEAELGTPASIDKGDPFLSAVSYVNVCPEPVLMK